MVDHRLNKPVGRKTSYSFVPWNLKEIIKLVYSENPVPSPDRVRVYAPDARNFWLYVEEFRRTLDANQRVLNPAFVPPLAFVELFVQSFLRSFMLACYYDIYLYLRLLPPGFTPSKVAHVLAQPIPKLLLDAIRELIRPMITPDGLMIIPHPDSFFNKVAYDRNVIIRNTVRLGDCDTFLTRYGIQWFPCLAGCLRAAWMTGTSNGEYALSLVSDTKREGLEPAKFSALIRIMKKKAEEVSGEPKAEARRSLSDAPTAIAAKTDAKEEKKFEIKFQRAVEVKSEVPPDWSKLGEESWSEKKWNIFVKDAVPDGYNDSIFELKFDNPDDVVRDYWMHDFDASTDSVRDFAMRILRPLKIRLFDDIYAGRVQMTVDPTPADISFLGIDVWRGALPYTIWQFQFFKDKMDGDPTLYVFGHYLGRWVSSLGEELKKWHFPTLGSKPSSSPVDLQPKVQISSGRRQRRSRRGGRGRGRGRGAPSAVSSAATTGDKDKGS